MFHLASFPIPTTLTINITLTTTHNLVNYYFEVKDNENKIKYYSGKMKCEVLFSLFLNPYSILTSLKYSTIMGVSQYPCLSAEYQRGRNKDLALRKS